MHGKQYIALRRNGTHLIVTARCSDRLGYLRLTSSIVQGIYLKVAISLMVKSLFGYIVIVPFRSPIQIALFLSKRRERSFHSRNGRRTERSHFCQTDSKLAPSPPRCVPEAGPTLPLYRTRESSCMIFPSQLIKVAIAICASSSIYFPIHSAVSNACVRGENSPSVPCVVRLAEPCPFPDWR